MVARGETLKLAQNGDIIQSRRVQREQVIKLVAVFNLNPSAAALRIQAPQKWRFYRRDSNLRRLLQERRRRHVRRRRRGLLVLRTVEGWNAREEMVRDGGLFDFAGGGERGAR